MRDSVIEVRDTCLLEADTISCSGIVINNADQSFVLTHATIVLPYLTKRIPLLNKLLKEGMLMSDYFKDLKINVTCERAVNISDSKVPEKPSFATAVINLTVGSNYRNDFVSVPGVLQCIWKLDKLSDSLKNLFSIHDDWKFAEVSQTEKESADSKDMPKYIFRLLSFFVLIKLSDRNIHSIATNRIDQHHSQLVVGNPLYVVGTPFGSLSPLVFMNSMSKGIVSNLAGKNQELILTDARCIPGTEGGGIYNGSPFDRSELVGMVIAPLCWKANEWIGMSLGCRLSEILSSLGMLVNGRKKIEVAPEKRFHTENIPVVYIQNISSWGSGVIIDQENGLALTCGHVVKGSTKVKVRLDIPHMTWYDTDVIYASPAGSVFDVALLKLKNYEGRKRWPVQVELDSNLEKGREVFIVGHSSFSDSHNLGPSVSSGIISSTAYHKNKLAIIQTTCCVNSGASGCPLVSTDGNLLGIVVCNARDEDSGATYPHVNLSIPAATIWPTIETYRRTGDKSNLVELSSYDDELRRIWTLNDVSLFSNSSSLLSKL